MSTHDLSHWEPRELPGQGVVTGEHVRVEPMHDARRFAELCQAFEGHDRLWDYLAYGPFETAEDFGRFANANYLGTDPMFHAIVPTSSNRAEGVAALMRIDPANGVIEIGHICLSPRLQQTRAATEAFALLFSRVFDKLGYRRLEWKCNDQNMPSKRAAARLGFTFEGVFRQHMVVKGRNRDTAWFSIVDAEWPKVKAGFEAWLQPENFDAKGRQRRSLSQLRP
ncbi:GNAT family N-acetyltransferase [Aureimonas phyllosphaerae]|uniref:RimJ/RimL family protein N-acetyltransferase n=1 Tax=Aureimonas phyllosphaerae TaxID=1166078 RepID=A0A7W6BVT6_9HYPH|nr:GNAT family protein [Aureimonas phyllosphaerae]MBB3935665.1 RimJ/RimL family protein N-acetyltransferase [Aureimonas phyllosphaerae]MBB3959673.1 RimJ/RimL family protein N-acetyltransferase [Aureimonas phyllosphaerae]SFF13594.1 Protein N-acetyltransferase, RimJ/RimL family [Aureimonas phyllosphaerae]